jgi:hypothetical protein
MSVADTLDRGDGDLVGKPARLSLVAAGASTGADWIPRDTDGLDRAPVSGRGFSPGW